MIRIEKNCVICAPLLLLYSTSVFRPSVKTLAHLAKILVVLDVASTFNAKIPRYRDDSFFAKFFALGCCTVKWWAEFSPPGRKNDRSSLQRLKEGHKILLLLCIELQLQDEIKEFHGVFEVSRRSSCRYGGESLIPRSGKVLMGPSVDDCRGE